MSVSPQPASGSSATATGKIRRVAILFAGGPAPAANAVISTAAASFLRNGIEVVGVLNGYSHLVEFGPDHPMQEGRDYIVLDQQEAPPVAEHPGHHDRHRPDQSRQGCLSPQPPDRRRTHRPVEDGPPGPLLAGRRRADLDRRRRHAQDREQVQDVSRTTCRPASGGSPWSTCPRRSTTTTAASISPSATSPRSRRWPRRSATCWPTPRRPAPTSSPSAWAGVRGGWPTGPPSPARPAWS